MTAPKGAVPAPHQHGGTDAPECTTCAPTPPPADGACICGNNPTIDGYRLRSRDCMAHPPRVTPMPEVRKSTPEEIELSCAWSDYRSAYGADSSDYKSFKAGWEAARGIQHNGVLR